MADGKMILSDEQRSAVQHDGNTLLSACPGSGKTRVIAAKLLRSIDEVRETPRRIACITYTNAGVYEIDDRVRSHGAAGDEERCDISTIHAFCLNNILGHFHWHLPEYRNGLSILPPDSERYAELVDETCKKYSLPPFARDGFEMLNVERDGSPVFTPPLTKEAVTYFWKLLRREGVVDFANIVYLSYRLLKERPRIARAVSCRFAWILLDEFQDTTTLQIELLELIARAGASRFFLVGDPAQSIYGFAGAKPGIAWGFAERINARSDFTLSVNHRCSPRIISHAEKLYPRPNPMTAGGKAAAYSEEPSWVQGDTLFQAITERYLPTLDALGIEYGRSAILAPWWVTLLHLGRQLREYEVPIVGPGARPYKRSHVFAQLAEQVCAYLEEREPAAIPRIERELSTLLAQATGRVPIRLFSYSGRTTVMRLLSRARALKDDHPDAMGWLNAAAASFTEALIGDQLLPRDLEHLLGDSVGEMRRDMEKNKVDVANLAIGDLGMFANPHKNLKLLTMHKAKGREFDAVALVDLHEGRVPNFRAKTQGEFDEARRLLYVGVTRAQRFLMYVTDRGDRRNVPSRFFGKDGLQLV